MKTRVFVGSLALTIFLTLPSFAAGAVAALVAKGDALHEKLRTSDALAVYLKAEKEAPDDAEVLWRTSRACAELMSETSSEGRQREFGTRALGYAQRAVTADPTNAQAHLALAICHGRVAPLLDSRAKISASKLVKLHAERSLELDSSNDYAHHVLGVWNYEVAGLNPILRTIAKIIYGGVPEASYDDAVKYLKKAVDLAPQRVAHQIELGRAYAALGRIDLARSALTQGLSLPNREKDDVATKARGRAALAKLQTS